MRLIKLLAGAVIMATLVGTPSASADATYVVLCEQAELECANPFPNPTTTHGLATEVKLLSTLGTVQCEKSLAELEFLNELSELSVSHLLDLKFEGNCHLGGTACTVTVNELGLNSFTKIGPLEASLKSTGGTKATTKCGFFINCTYGGEPLLKVHSNAEGITSVLANKTKLTGSGFLCPEVAEWDAAYTAVNPGTLEPVKMWIES